jgi:hypothetical protein
MKNYDLMTTASIPFVRVGPLLKAISRDEFTFAISHEPFPTSVVQAVAFSVPVREQLQVATCARGFIICDASFRVSSL